MKIDNTPPGPARWERAALNAVRRPNGKAAKLYYARVANARLIADALPKGVDGPYAFMHFRPNGVDYRKPGFAFNYAREYAVCSTYCMVMIAQLRTSNATALMPDLTKVHAFIGGEVYRWNFDKPIVPAQPKYLNILPLDVKTLKRSVRCFCCGTQIGSKS